MELKRQLVVMAWTGRVCLVAALALAAWAAWAMRQPAFASAPAIVGVPEFAPAAHVAAEDWAVFAPATGGTNADETTTSAVAGSLRLAGIFGTIGEDGTELRKAILGDDSTKEQAIVSRGEKFAGWTVQEVGDEHVAITRNGERKVLTMSFAGGEIAAQPAAATASDELLEPEETVLEETPYGKKVGDTRWVLSKRSMQNYYQQLLDNPERIAALYMSLKPIYAGKDITGYHLNQEGERDFFKAMGLTEGDVVRKVNSMNMTSQSRAEYFIGEFVKDRLGALVLDIERGGKPEKLIYLFR